MACILNIMMIEEKVGKFWNITNLKIYVLFPKSFRKRSLLKVWWDCVYEGRICSPVVVDEKKNQHNAFSENSLRKKNSTHTLYTYILNFWTLFRPVKNTAFILVFFKANQSSLDIVAMCHWAIWKKKAWGTCALGREGNP